MIATFSEIHQEFTSKGFIVVGTKYLNIDDKNATFNHSFTEIGIGRNEAFEIVERLYVHGRLQINSDLTNWNIFLDARLDTDLFKESTARKELRIQIGVQRGIQTVIETLYNSIAGLK